MKKLKMLARMLSTISSEYEKNLINRYFSHFFNKVETNQQLVCEMLEAFPLPLVRFVDIFFIREVYNDLP